MTTLDIDDQYSQSRSFQEFLAEADIIQQTEYLRYYREHAVRNQCVCAEPLGLQEIFGIILALPDTAAGHGGVPYAAWRLIALVASALIRQLLTTLIWQPTAAYNAIDTRKQIRVWIEKKGKPLHPDTMRGLGLSACCFRMLSAATHEIIRRAFIPVLDPAQLMIHQGAEVMRWVEYAKRYLDGEVIERDRAASRNATADAVKLILNITKYRPPSEECWSEPREPSCEHCECRNGGSLDNPQRTTLAEDQDVHDSQAYEYADAERWTEKLHGQNTPNVRPQVSGHDDLRMIGLGGARQAFQRIDPFFVLYILGMFSTPLWLVILVATCLFRRGQECRARTPWHA